MELTLGSIFPLAPADLEAERPSLGSTTPAIKRIRAVHHQAARLMATGATAAEVSLTTGLSPSRQSILKNDPSFKQLLQHYAEIDAEVFVNVREKVAALGVTAAEVLQERLEEAPEAVSIKELTNILSTALDRGGFAPVQKSIAVSGSFAPEDIEALKAALGQAPTRERLSHTITVEKEASSVPTDSGAQVGAAFGEASPSAETPSGLPGEGPGV